MICERDSNIFIEVEFFFKERFGVVQISKRFVKRNSFSVDSSLLDWTWTCGNKLIDYLLKLIFAVFFSPVSYINLSPSNPFKLFFHKPNLVPMIQKLLPSSVLNPLKFCIN